MERIDYRPSMIPVVDHADVVVVGGGPAGVGAALASARSGSSVVVVEKTGICGGVATMGLPIQGFDYADGRPLVRGIAWELYQALVASGDALSPLIPCSLHNPYAVIDPDACSLQILAMLDEAGVRVWNHTHFVDTVIDNDGKIKHIVVAGKEGLAAISGRFFIDATGDGDVAAASGIPFTVGRETDSIPQSATVDFTLCNVDFKRFARAVSEDDGSLYDTHPLLDRSAIAHGKPYIMVGLRNLIERAQRETGVLLPCRFASYITAVSPGCVTINMTHVPLAMGHTMAGLSKAEQQGRRQVRPILDFLRNYAPGFDGARISRIASHVGIRESRHIKGMYTLTEQDVVNGVVPSDTIALGGYPIDIHSPVQGDVHLQRVPPYGIPLRCLQISEIANLLVTGRALSAEHVALASCRLISQCMAFGEAAGVGAHLALVTNRPANIIDSDMVRKVLKERKAIVELTDVSR